MLTLPGLIDPHVHLREPGGTHKEDFDTGTAAALAGGFTAVLAMPNTRPPLTDRRSLALAQQAGGAKARCDYALFLGAGDDNAASAASLAPQVVGLKIYMDQTFGPLRLESLATLHTHVAAWPPSRPIVAHAEGVSLAAILMLARLYDRAIHVAHVSRREEILLIRAAKEKGWRVTCEATPHHLFLSQVDIPLLGDRRSEVRPSLATPADREALWANLDVIDCFATDHAPHTAAEKEGPDPPPGFPGLETALGLFFRAVNDGRLTVDELVARMHTNPRRIFGLPVQPETSVEVDARAEWQVIAGDFHSRSGWSPFEGMTLTGRVRRVTLRGRPAFRDGEVLAAPGTGLDLAPLSYTP
jgi:carbamoyl-phosphate synthase/aspartate carbamoyltransferase/dihydroorotase